MKKYNSAFSALVFTALSFTAQSSYAQADKGDKKDEVSFKVGYGIKGGLNVANITIDNNGSVNDKHAIPSYNAGVYADVALLPVLSIQPGLFLSGKGAKFTVGDDGSDNYTHVRTAPVYLELPVNAVVKLPLFNKVKLFFGAGPYIAMGIGGKNTIDGKLAGVSYSDNSGITYGNDELNDNGTAYKGNLKHFDAGVNVIGGIEISHFTLNANLGYGLVNIKPGSANGVDYKYENRVFALQIGFIL